MTQTAHTPGPDRVLVSSCKVFGEGVNNSIKYRGLYREFSETEYIRSNPAREAAPDLLEALENACSTLVFADGLLADSGSSSVVIDVAIEEARAAIASAKGGAA